MEDISKEQLKVILDFFKKDKSPIPYAWTMEFFNGFYDLLEEDFLWVVEEVRMSSEVLGAINSTFLALVPKKDTTNSFDDFMPISLCNFSI
jgi:hypothetical protein